MLPTTAELEILHVLWEHQPCTVREVHERLERDPPTGYTTVLKQLQVMTGKGLVTRDESSRSHTYCAAVGEGETQGGLLSNLMNRAFGGSMGQMVLRAISSQELSKEELAEIRAAIDGLEGEE